MIKDIFDTLKSFNGKQWAVMSAILAGSISAYAYIENRYASKDTADMILENLIVIDSKISAIITTQYTKEQIDKIGESAKIFEAQMRRYREDGAHK
jgi:hypothetical protein